MLKAYLAIKKSHITSNAFNIQKMTQNVEFCIMFPRAKAITLYFHINHRMWGLKLQV